MSAKIVPFPEQTESPLQELDGYIQAYLAEIAADRDFIQHVSQRMRSFIEKYASKSFEPTFKLVVPPNLSREQADALVHSIEAGVQATAAEVQGMVREIIFERLQLEIDIYLSRERSNHSRGESQKGYLKFR